jgi:hypothetical protein
LISGLPGTKQEFINLTLKIMRKLILMAMIAITVAACSVPERQRNMPRKVEVGDVLRFKTQSPWFLGLYQTDRDSEQYIVKEIVSEGDSLVILAGGFIITGGLRDEWDEVVVSHNETLLQTVDYWKGNIHLKLDGKPYGFFRVIAGPGN